VKAPLRKLANYRRQEMFERTCTAIAIISTAGMYAAFFIAYSTVPNLRLDQIKAPAIASQTR
tara:strand:+ start:87 stop:272 length:186 start_codon:yes stop_codon:yes gene_type:complete